MANKRKPLRGRTTVSGVSEGGGSSIVSGPERKGSAGGPVKRRSKAVRDSENQRDKDMASAMKANPSHKSYVPKAASRAKSLARHNTKIAADPGNKGRLRPSERTPSKAKSYAPSAVDSVGGRDRYVTDSAGGTHRVSPARMKAKAVLSRMGKKKKAGKK